MCTFYFSQLCYFKNLIFILKFKRSNNNYFSESIIINNGLPIFFNDKIVNMKIFMQ